MRVPCNFGKTFIRCVFACGRVPFREWIPKGRLGVAEPQVLNSQFLNPQTLPPTTPPQKNTHTHTQNNDPANLRIIHDQTWQIKEQGKFQTYVESWRSGLSDFWDSGSIESRALNPKPCHCRGWWAGGTLAEAFWGRPWQLPGFSV